MKSTQLWKKCSRTSRNGLI
ncbi:MAG: hypothetical protein ABR542_00025, partial [Desulfonatronovibrio sp.]